VPSFRATLRDLDTGRNLGSFVGTGCHRSPEIALSRALTEAAQTRLTLIAGSRDDVFPSYYRRRSVPSEPTLLPGPRRIMRDDTSPGGDRSFGADLAHVLDRLRATGIRNAAVFDHTDPGIGVTVVKVIVPDLRMNRLEPVR